MLIKQFGVYKLGFATCSLCDPNIWPKYCAFLSYSSLAELCFSMSLKGAESVNLVVDCGLPDMQHLSKL